MTLEEERVFLDEERIERKGRQPSLAFKALESYSGKRFDARPSNYIKTRLFSCFCDAYGQKMISVHIPLCS